ncbi:MAG: hypothetical protein ACON35_00660 [Candidatus Marinamargulisbacteria bacterium]
MYKILSLPQLKLNSYGLRFEKTKGRLSFFKNNKNLVELNNSNGKWLPSNKEKWNETTFGWEFIKCFKIMTNAKSRFDFSEKDFNKKNIKALVKIIIYNNKIKFLCGFYENSFLGTKSRFLLFASPEIKDKEQYPFIVFDGEQLKIYKQLYQTNAIQGLYKVDEGGAFFNISNSADPNKNLGCCTLQ